MKIVAISDLHGFLDPIHTLLDCEKPNVLLCAGDWGIQGEIAADDFKKITTKVYTLTVFGNHDYLDLLPLVRNQDASPILLENGVTRTHRGVVFGGINGIWAKSKKKPWYVNDEEVISAANEMRDSEVDILVTHGCPIGMADLTPIGTHGGQRCFTEAFRIVNPMVHICGHLHRKSRYKTKDGRLVFNIGYTKEGDYAVLQRHDGSFHVEAKVLR